MKKIFLIYFVLVGLSMACTDKFDDYNTDDKNPAAVKGEFLFTNAQKELVDQISNTNVNLNVWKLFAQYWTETTYTDEANYDIINRSIPDNAFRTYYRDVFNPLKQAKALITNNKIGGFETAVTIANKIAIIDIIEVYGYYNLMVTFGDIPYSEALDIENINPKYDDAETVSLDLLNRLNTDIATLLSVADSKSFFNGADKIYGGNIVAWTKFAQSLKLKIGITIADANSQAAQTAVESAITGGVFTSSADNAVFVYENSTPNTNKLHEDLVLSGRSDFVPANTIVDLMVGLNDPRVNNYFTNMIDTSTEDGVVKMAWIGGVYGASNSFPNCSHINDVIQTATFPGFLLTYDEILFYMAEAAERGYAVGMTAEEAYNAAITASFNFWGAAGADTYLATAEVAYTTATGDWRQKIGTQAYIAFYTRGLIGYTEYRRLDYPQMNVAPSAATDGPVPTRFTYPVNEQTLNKANYAAAAAAIGGDDLLTRIFWDIADPAK